MVGISNSKKVRYLNAVNKMKMLKSSLEDPHNLVPIYSLLDQRMYELQSEGDTTFVLEPTDLPEVTNEHDRAYFNQLLQSIRILHDIDLHDKFLVLDYQDIAQELGLWTA
jgi:hypothetical protein